MTQVDSATKRGRGRPRKPDDEAVSRGQFVHARFPQAVIRQMREIAPAEGLTVTAWVRHLVYQAIARRKKQAAS
jgi:hypothetical protein